jgi:hypothetical protein
VARRQYGKTTTVAGISLKKMMKTRGHTVIFGSAKLTLSREIVRKESEIIHQAFRSLPSASEAARVRFVDDAPGGVKQIPQNISADDFAEIFEAQRLETRFYHSNNASDYSRTKVVALTPDTVGETGDLITDEIRAIKNWREVAEAIAPIISSNPLFRWILTTTPPTDDTHYGFEQLAPRIGAEFKANPEGNEYISDAGIYVLRVDAWDAAADGVPLYDDDSGAPLAPEEHRRKAHDKEAWDRNYACKFLVGGSSACGLVQLNSAQARGIGKCRLFVIDDEADFEAAIKWLADNIGSAKCALGVDWATTEKGISNPTSVSVVENNGSEIIIRAVFVWKTADPDVATARLTAIVKTCNERKAGGRIRAVCQDATNERYHCKNIRKALRQFAPVYSIVSSASCEKSGEPMNWKQYLGNQYVAVLDDNKMTAPPERYFREDHRLVKKHKGSFDCEADVNGRHGDTFDSGKLGVEGTMNKGGDPFATKAIGLGSYAGGLG